MIHIGSYTVVALCIVLTSAGVIDFPGNRDDFHDNIISSMKEEKVLTPPSNNGLNIDSNGYPGNSNENKKEETNCTDLCLSNKENNSCQCNLPPFLNGVLASMLDPNNESSNYQIIPFTKEDILKLKYSKLCKIMCENGVNKPPCEC